MTMLIFSRRALQQRLETLESVLTSDVHLQLIKRLESPGRDRLPAMWETVFLSALNGVTTLRYEAPLIDGSKPDFTLNYSYGDTTFEIVGDITTASDKGLHENNPIGHFQSEIVRLALKYDLNPNHFCFDVNGGLEGEFGDSRMVLFLPPKKQFAALVKAHIEPFIRGLARNPTAEASLPCAAPKVDFTLTYNQSHMFTGSGNRLRDLGL